MISTGMTTASVTIPRCEHTGLTLPECSCRACLQAMLVRVGYAAPQAGPTAPTK